MAGLALALALVAYLLPLVPLAQKVLDMRWPVHPVYYGIVVLATLGWAVVLTLVWKLIPEDKAGGRSR